MIKSNFEGTDFFRNILKVEFNLRETVIELDNCLVYLWKHRLYNRLISTPYRDRISLAYEVEKPSKMDLNALYNAVGEKTVLLKDVGEYIKDYEGCAKIITSFVNSDVVLDNNLEMRFYHAARKNYKKAKNQYKLEVVANEIGKIDEFYSIYLKTRKRLGVLPYSKYFFKMLFDELGKKVVLFSCKLEDKNVGYLLCYIHEKEMISGHIAYIYELRNYRITDYLFINAFLWGREHNYTIYRFGSDNKEQESLIKFKEKLGAQRREQIDICFGDYKQLNLQSRKGLLLRKCISRSPNFLYKYSSVGTKLYFS